MSNMYLFNGNWLISKSIGDCLGRGAFGSVYRGLNTFSGETVAIKQIKLKTLQGTDAAEMMVC